RIGVLSTFAESDPEAQSMVEALDQTLQELGWVEGRNLRIDRRWAAGNPGRLDGFVKLLIALEPDVLVAHAPPQSARCGSKHAAYRSCSYRLPTRSVVGSLRATRSPAETSPASPPTNLRWLANGEKCSRRSRPEFRESRFCSTRKRRPMSSAISKN